VRFGLSFALVIALASSANANIESFLKDSVSVSSSGAAYTSSQTRGVYSLGEMKVSTGDIGSIGLPIKFTPPRVSAGCGGIDISLGGFQFLLDDMVEKFKKIAAAAPAFAFQIALNFLCPECSQMMAQLEALANKLNSMNIDGCTAMQGLSDWTSNTLADTEAGKAMKGGAINTFASNITSWAKDPNSVVNQFASGVESFKQDYLGYGASAADAKKGAENIVWTGSLVDKVFDENKNLEFLMGTAEDSKIIMRAITGDIVRYQNETQAPTVISPVFNTNDLEALMEGGGKKVRGIELDFGPKVKEIVIQKGMKQHFKERLTAILTKISTSLKTNTPSVLAPEERGFINAMPLPIYKMLNTEAQAGLASADSSSIETLAAILASMQANKLLSDLMGKVYASVATYANNNAKTLNWGGAGFNSLEGKSVIQGQIMHNITLVNDVLNKKLMLDAENFKKQADTLEYYKKLDKEITAKFAANGIYTTSILHY